jgi:hypothetical protein
VHGVNIPAAEMLHGATSLHVAWLCFPVPVAVTTTSELPPRVAAAGARQRERGVNDKPRYTKLARGEGGEEADAFDTVMLASVAFGTQCGGWVGLNASTSSLRRCEWALCGREDGGPGGLEDERGGECMNRDTR